VSLSLSLTPSSKYLVRTVLHPILTAVRSLLATGDQETDYSCDSAYAFLVSIRSTSPMPPKAEKHKKEKKKHDSAAASSSSGSSAAKQALFSTAMIPIPSRSSFAPSSSMPPFTLATWNVLADDHVYPHYYPQCTKKQLSWSERLPQLLKRIRDLDPDILCMQEVDNWKDWDITLKERGYTNVYLARGGSKQDGCSISFKTDLFSVVDRMEVRFDDMADFPFEDGQRIRKHCVALGLVLRPTGGGASESGESDIFVVTTHLFWNPKFEDVKLRQAIYLTYHIYQFWNKPQRVILCGDMNSTPDSAIATFLRTGRIDLRTWSLNSISGRGYKGACTGYSVFGIGSNGNASGDSLKASAADEPASVEPIDQSSPLDHDQIFQLLKCPAMSHRLKLESVYENRLPDPTSAASSSSSASSSSTTKQQGKGRRGSIGSGTRSGIHEPITSHFQQFSGTLDYIFSSPGVTPTAILNLPTDQEINDIGFLPTADFASDHLVLMAQFQLGGKKT